MPKCAARCECCDEYARIIRVCRKDKSSKASASGFEFRSLEPAKASKPEKKSRGVKRAASKEKSRAASKSKKSRADSKPKEKQLKQAADKQPKQRSSKADKGAAEQCDKP